MNGNVGCARACEREASCCFVRSFFFSSVFLEELFAMPLGFEVDFRVEEGLERFFVDEVARLLRLFFPMFGGGFGVRFMAWCEDCV